MRIAITGIGIISAIGQGIHETLAALEAEQSGVGTMQHLRSTHTEFPVGEVKACNDTLRQIAGVDATMPISRNSLLGIVAAKEAMQNANLTCCDTTEMAFISGTTVGGMDTTEQHYLSWVEGKDLEYLPLHDAGASTRAIAEQIGTFAYQTTPSTACSSALNSLILGANLMRAGKVRRALVGGTESLTSFHLNGFRSLMILDEECCKPFDANRKGLNLGEGAAYLVLETEDDALARGAKIWGYLTGYANRCDAFHQTASSPDGAGAYHSMTEAIAMAGLQPEAIDYVNAHGTGTPNNDLSESTALTRVFGDTMPAVSSTKAFTGHTTSASGSIEAAICLLCMEKDIVPASLHWQTPMENGFLPQCTTARKCLQHVLCNSFGFGGNDSSIILSKAVNPDTRYHTDASIACVEELTICITEDDEIDYKQYIAPSEARRLTPQVRRCLVAAKKALQEAGIEQPDAIITGTKWGANKHTVTLLEALTKESENAVKPTPFMQSTHNTMSSLIAIQTKCHGYNVTYANGEQSMDDALLDARTQIALGLIENALVIGFEEADEEWNMRLGKIGETLENTAIATILRRKIKDKG